MDDSLLPFTICIPSRNRDAILIQNLEHLSNLQEQLGQIFQVSVSVSGQVKEKARIKSFQSPSIATSFVPHISGAADNLKNAIRNSRTNYCLLVGDDDLLQADFLLEVSRSTSQTDLTAALILGGLEADVKPRTDIPKAQTFMRSAALAGLVVQRELALIAFEEANSIFNNGIYQQVWIALRSADNGFTQEVPGALVESLVDDDVATRMLSRPPDYGLSERYFYAWTAFNSGLLSFLELIECTLNLSNWALGVRASLRQETGVGHLFRNLTFPKRDLTLKIIVALSIFAAKSKLATVIPKVRRLKEGSVWKS